MLRRSLGGVVCGHGRTADQARTRSHPPGCRAARAAPRRARVVPAARLVAGEFMEGFAVPGASGFEDWLTSERTLWRRRSVEALVHCAEELLAAGLVREAVASAGRATALDPRSDFAVRSSIRSLALAGERAAALRDLRGIREVAGGRAGGPARARDHGAVGARAARAAGAACETERSRDVESSFHSRAEAVSWHGCWRPPRGASRGPAPSRS